MVQEYAIGRRKNVFPRFYRAGVDQLNKRFFGRADLNMRINDLAARFNNHLGVLHVLLGEVVCFGIYQLCPGVSRS